MPSDDVRIFVEATSSLQRQANAADLLQVSRRLRGVFVEDAWTSELRALQPNGASRQNLKSWDARLAVCEACLRHAPAPTDEDLASFSL